MFYHILQTCNFCSNESTFPALSDIFALISIFIALCTFLITIYIPIKIKWEQLYQGLFAELRSLEFGKAMQNVINFFVDDCKNDVERIKEEYEKKGVNSELHYQRRYLAQFYYQLDLCAKTPFFLIGKERVLRDFTTGEAKLLKILYFMDKAIDESDVLYRDISCSDRVPMKSKGMNGYICHIYHILKKSGRQMK